MTSGIPQVALVGYTNAGKSTLLNKMIKTYCPDEEKEVMVKDMLFATLDTTVRKITPPDHRDFLLSDTVGFINDLPHDLVNAFRSTLEEAVNADLILEVIDYSDKNYQMHMDVTAKTLKELEAGHIPVLYVMNKSDRKYPEYELPVDRGDKIYISAEKGIGIELLLQKIDEKLFSDYLTMELIIPYTKGNVEHDLQERARVISVKYKDDGIHMTADLNQEMIKRYKEFIQ
jgi:GTP-binding protein HflX